MITVITTPNLERLKQKARKLKRQNAITHTQALDEVAKIVGLNHWHDVIKANNHVVQAEKAFKDGLILAFEQKDADGVDTSDGELIEDQMLEMFIEQSLFEVYSNHTDEDGKPYSETYSLEELKEDFQFDCSYMYFRLKNAEQMTVDRLYAFIEKYSFWQPIYIWHKGKIIDWLDFVSE